MKLTFNILTTRVIQCMLLRTEEVIEIGELILSRVSRVENLPTNLYIFYSYDSISENTSFQGSFISQM